MMKAAGILVKTQGAVLFLKRGPEGDYPGYWCFPGGKIEDGETAEQAAVRECQEEIGSAPKGARAQLCRTQIALEPLTSVAPGGTAPDSPPSAVPPTTVDFTTFVQVVPDQFEITLDHEHVGHAWAPADQPPEPLHPGCRTALAVLAGNELDIARMLASGVIRGPQVYKNVTLFPLRITGTGVAYRRAKKDEKGREIRAEEFAFREPALYLNDEFLARCNGLPVIFQHPEKSVLNSEEFADRIVGTILLPYIQGNEVWGVAKIYDDAAIRIMSDPEKPMSTSPAVVLGDPSESTRLTMDDGAVILIEGKPSLLDHLAICERGVWDKGGEPTGIIINDSQETEDMLTKEEIAAMIAASLSDSATARADADKDNGEKLDKLLDSMGGFAKKLDSVCARVDAMEGDPEKIAADKSRKDAEDKEAKEKADAEEKEKADAEEKEKAEKEKADALAKADSEVARRIADVERRLPVHLTDADFRSLTDAQAKADSVFQAFGDHAPRPLSGESVVGYRKRIATSLRVHSPTWKGVDVTVLADDAFDIAERHIYSDSMTASLHPTDIPEGTMRAITRRDRVTGHDITTFAGKNSFVRDFSQVQRRAVAFRQRRDRD